MKSPMTRGAVGLIVSLSTLWSVPSHALTLDETIQRTQAAHPQFKAYSALQRASRADVDTLSLAPPLILSGEADNLIGNGSYQQADWAGSAEPAANRHYRPTNSQKLRVSPGPYRY